MSQAEQMPDWIENLLAKLDWLRRADRDSSPKGRTLTGIGSAPAEARRSGSKPPSLGAQFL
jgi:hypothetical protein